MILIVGGAYQGKFEFAERLLNTSEESGTATVADGASDPPETAFECGIVDHFHEYVRRFFTGEEDIKISEKRLLAYCDSIITENPDVLIVSDLIGGGIVPTEAEDRRWRDLSGEACEYLAGKADQVYRVICGIPQILKGMEA